MSLSLLISNVRVTGSSLLYNANFTGIGGTQVFVSGQQIFVSGAAGSGGGGGGTVTQPQLDALSGFTTGVSGYLLGRIIGAAAGVSSLNGASGAITLVGTGGISIGANGQLIYISGANWATSGDLLGLSGWVNANFATVINLGLTGQTLYQFYAGLSGALGITGANLYSLVTSLSGVTNTLVAATGQAAWISANGAANTLSGLIGQTGANLYAVITGMSGQANATFATQTQLTQSGVQLGATIIASGNAAVAQANSIGATLSGLLTQTGTQLSAVKVTGSSVINVANFTGIGGVVVTYSGNQIFISGVTGSSVGGGLTSLNSLQGVVNILGSGGITATLQSQNIVISGDSTLSGLIAATGQQNYSITTGLSGYIIGLISAASAGVSSINGASGVLTLGGAGGIAVLTNGQNIVVSGQNWLTTGAADARYATTGLLSTTSGVLQSGLAATGSILYIDLTGASGALVTQIAATGSAAVAYANSLGTNLSGNLGATGAALYTMLTGESGALVTQIIATGQAAINQANSIGSVISGNLTQSGVLLGNQIAALSGYSNTFLVHRTGNELISGAKTFIIDATRPFLVGSGTSTYFSVTPSAVTLNDSSASIALNANARTLTDSFGNAVLSWTSYQLSDSNPAISLDWGARRLFQNDGATIVLDWTAMNLNGNWTTNAGTNASGALVNFFRLSGVSGSFNTRLTQTGALLSAVQVTGSSIINLVNLTGLGGTLVFQSGNQVFISGAGGGGAAGVSSLNSLLGTINITGTGGLTASINGQTILISGDSSISGALTQTGVAIYGLITGGSGLYVTTGTMLSYLSGISTGSDAVYFNYLGYTFPNIPRVVATMETANSNYGYLFTISGRSTTGFWSLFSDTILETGLFLDIVVKL